jgi:hypothetical protein
MRREIHIDHQDARETAAAPPPHGRRVRRGNALGPAPHDRRAARHHPHGAVARKATSALGQQPARPKPAPPEPERRAPGPARTLAIGIGLVALLSYIGWICMEMGYRVHMGDETLEALAGAMFLAVLAAAVGARSRR